MMFWICLLVGLIAGVILGYQLKSLFMGILSGLGFGCFLIGIACLLPLEYHYTGVHETVSVEQIDGYTVETKVFYKENPWLVPWQVEMSRYSTVKVEQ